jgi:hypothetical protein
MKEATGNLWDYPADLRVITTNGTVRKDGACVMGRGCAYEATQKFPPNPGYPGIAWKLGNAIRAEGNIPFVFLSEGLITFPVKHSWFEPADPTLIAHSVEWLKEWLAHQPNVSVVMPRPGCGNGQLKWEDVKPLLESLPDSVTVITFA